MAATSIAELRNNLMSNESPLSPLLAKGYTPSFDPDAYHVMQERDNALIRDEILHGYASKAFVYEFEIQGKKVRGVSVVGARELATQYKGIKHRLVATVEKRGALFIFRSFEPINITTQVLPELADEDDYYECIVEISDIKTGNSLQCRKKESKVERRRDGTPYIRPHYDVIAESKAFRNGVLSILPQNVIKDFEAKCLQAGNASQEETIDQLRAKVVAFGAKYAITLDRKAVFGLSFAEILGLGNAAKSGNDAFLESAQALGLVSRNSEDPQTGSETGETKKQDGGMTDDEKKAAVEGEKAESAGQQAAPAQRTRSRNSANASME